MCVMIEGELLDFRKANLNTEWMGRSEIGPSGPCGSVQNRKTQGIKLVAPECLETAWCSG